MKPEEKEAMASHKPDASSESSNKKAEDDSKHKVLKEQQASTGGLHELLEQVEEMYKTFLVSPEVVSEDPESGKTQPWGSRRQELEKGKEKSGSSLSAEGSPWPPRQQAARAKIPSSRKFQPRYGLPDFQPEWQETDDLVKSMRKILHNPLYKEDDNARLYPEDEVKVRGVFEYHPKAEEKTGPGIDYIKIKHIHDEDTRCFWVVRMDGTEIDFSYHKCLKAKVALEVPDLLEHYESLYMTRKQTQQRTRATSRSRQTLT